MKTTLSALLAGALLVSNALSELRTASVIGDHMVLQRDKPCAVWGWADAKATVDVSFGDQKKQATAGDDGKWMVKLDAMEASAEPRVLTISSGDAKIEVQDVLVGEVWLCSGQSNMEWSMNATHDAKESIAGAEHPNIRLFKTPNVFNAKPQDRVDANWQACTPQTVPGFSAVGYHFGRRLHADLGVPIGLIASDWGGTRIEPWTPPVGFEAVEATRKILADVRGWKTKHQKQLAEYATRMEAWLAKAKQASADNKEIPMPGDPPRMQKFGNQTPTALYNTLIHPLVPCTMRGAIWYQGESNNGEGMLYHEKMKALIHGWRTVFENPELAFYFVQLAPYRYGNGEHTLPYIWEAQAATLKVPHTGMAVITDIGNVNDIHPRNKRDVGERLARWALARNYGKKDVVVSGPLYKSMAVDGNKVRLRFAHVGGGLVSRDDKPLSDFTIAGADGKFVAAEATIEGETVVVHSAEVAEPKNVRFAWHHMVNPNFGNKAGLPASPFKTDEWQGGTAE